MSCQSQPYFIVLKKDHRCRQVGLIIKCLLIFLRQQTDNQKYENHPVKFFSTTELFEHNLTMCYLLILFKRRRKKTIYGTGTDIITNKKIRDF